MLQLAAGFIQQWVSRWGLFHLFSGYSSVWQSAWFGTRMPQVRALLPAPHPTGPLLYAKIR